MAQRVGEPILELSAGGTGAVAQGRAEAGEDVR